MNLPPCDATTIVIYGTTELKVGYTIEPADWDTNLPECFMPAYVLLLNGSDVTDLVDYIPHFWDSIAEKIAENVAYERANTFEVPEGL